MVSSASSTSDPLIYRFISSNPMNVTESLQAFSMQLSMYLLIRSFFFFLLRKKYIDIPIQPEATSQMISSTISSPIPNPLSPVPIDTPKVMQPAIPEEYAASATQLFGMMVDCSGEDLEMKRTVNAPSIYIDQKVEISRVNRYLSCMVMPSGVPAGNKPVGQTAYLAIGRSQLSLLEMVKGSMKDAVVLLVFSLHEVLDICIEDNTHRTLSILVVVEV
jgi:hypothetical protein